METFPTLIWKMYSAVAYMICDSNKIISVNPDVYWQIKHRRFGLPNIIFGVVYSICIKSFTHKRRTSKPLIIAFVIVPFRLKMGSSDASSIAFFAASRGMSPRYRLFCEKFQKYFRYSPQLLFIET